MDFFSKFTKPDQPKSASDVGQEPNTTEPANTTDLFNSAKVVAGAAQSYFSQQPATCDNAKVAGATADILDAASEYGKLDKTQGAGKYVDQAENYLKEYKTSNTTAPPAAAKDTVADAGAKSFHTEGADASTEKSNKPGSYEDTTESKPGVGAATETDTGGDCTQSGGKIGEDTEEGFSKNFSGGDDYQEPKVDKYEDSTEEGFAKKPAAAVTDASEDYTEKGAKPNKPLIGSESGDSGYMEDTEEGLPKPSAGSHGAAADDAGDKVSQAEGGFGNFTKMAGGFLNK